MQNTVYAASTVATASSSHDLVLLVTTAFLAALYRARAMKNATTPSTMSGPLAVSAWPMWYPIEYESMGTFLLPRFIRHLVYIVDCPLWARHCAIFGRMSEEVLCELGAVGEDDVA